MVCGGLAFFPPFLSQKCRLVSGSSFYVYMESTVKVKRRALRGGGKCWRSRMVRTEVRGGPS